MTKACPPLALVSITVAPDMYTISICLTALPLADIGVSVLTAPYPVSLFDAAQPLTVVDFTVRPGENTLTVGFALNKLPLIGVGIDKPFEASAMSLVVRPLALINSAVVIDDYTFSIAFAVFELTLVYGILVLFDPEALTGLDYLEVELVTFHLII
jgi:hypothetical protein